MNRIILVLFSVVLMLCSHGANAHHAFSATFAKDQKTSVQGVVTRFNYKNPHVLLYFDVTNADGSVTEWLSEGNSATLLRRSGWDRDSMQPGDLIRVTGDSSRDGSPMTSIDFVEILDPITEEVVEVKVRDNSLELYMPAVEESVPLELADGRPNLELTWAIQYRGFGPPPVPAVPLNEVGMAVQVALDLADDPQIFCDPPGLARQAVTHHPLRFTQNEDHIIMEYEEFAGRRVVYFDERAAKDVNTHLGDSIARYDGNRLIVETTNLLSNLTTTEGNRYSDQARMIETYHRVDEDEGRTALHLNIVLSDPLYLAEDLVVNKVLWDAGTEYEMLENDCHGPLRQRNEVNPVMSYFVPSTAAETFSPETDEGMNMLCQTLATSVRQGHKNWTAISSLGDLNRETAGTIYNAKGELIEAELSALTAVDERGNPLDMDAALGFQCVAVSQ